jgi:glycosyltransferase involved in cell wall biosynthesis
LKNPLNIIIVAQNFFPENFKSNDIAFDLKRKGHNVTVLTGIPHYPQGRYYKGYNLFRRRVEVIKGVNVYRCFQVPRGKRFSKILLPFTYLSFMIFASFWAIYLSFRQKYDLVFVHQVSPITQTLPAILIKKIQRIPMLLWVLDLWPDAYISGSGKKNLLVFSLLEKYVAFSYKNSNKILVSSRGFESPIKSKISEPNKVLYFPNWAEDVFENFILKEIPELPKGFKIMLAGNLGVSQNLENVLKVAIKLRTENIKWIIIGDGSKKESLDLFVSENKLENSVFLLGKFPIDYMPSFYQHADLMLLSLGNEYSELKQVVPARIQSYMAAGKPILGFLDGAAANLIKEAQCGYVASSDDIEGMVSLIKNIILPNIDELSSLGINGKNYYYKNFNKKNCIDKLENIFYEFKDNSQVS